MADPVSSAPAGRSAIVFGAGGSLGSAVLESALAGGFGRVTAVVGAPVAPALPALRTAAADALPPADTAFIVYDRARHANGREAAFARPQPESLPQDAARLRGAGVRRLVVVQPHAAALLPEALKRGLATLDEQAVAAMDFEHLLFVRPAAAPSAAAGGAAQRLAGWMLSQLHFMVPAAQQPVQPARLAAFVLALARALPSAPPGVRIVPPELVWQAARQPGDDDRLAADWLEGGTLPPPRSPRRRW